MTEQAILTFDAATVLKFFRDSAVPASQLSAPAGPGVYAFFLRNEDRDMALLIRSYDPIYIGSSKNLAQRQFQTHFNSKQTGFSTIRRSLGALLKERLQLVAIPRGNGNSRQDFYCYRFTEDGEERLTDWMARHVVIAVYPTSDFRVSETALIAEAAPLLNIRGSSSPEAARLMELRKACADEARKRHREN